MRKLFLLLLLYPVFLFSHAQPGSLVTTFGIGGIVKESFSNNPSSFNSIAFQPDGKMIVGGSTGDSLGLARFNPNGSLDPSFGNGGKVVVRMGKLRTVTKVIVLQDGKIVVGASWDNGSDRGFGLARFNADGSVDNAFIGNGNVTYPYFRSPDLAVQADGKILATGTGPIRDEGDYQVMRFNPDGSPDATFGNNGLLLIDIVDTDDYAYSVAIQPDGKILVGGITDNTCWCRPTVALVRLLPDGTLDNSFGDGGKALVDFVDPYHGITSLAIQPDGKILVVSEGLVRTYDFGFGLARFNTDGSLDASFGSEGIVMAEIPNASAARYQFVNLQTDGKIIVSGTAIMLESGATPGGFTHIRFLPDGQLDPSFGVNGMVEGLTDSLGNSIDGDLTASVIHNNVLYAVGNIYSSGGLIAAYQLSACSANYVANIPDVHALFFVGEANTIYKGFGPSSVVLRATATGGVEPYTYLWSTGDTSAAIRVRPDAPGVYNYTVYVTDNSGCVVQATKSIKVVDVRCGNRNDKILVCKKNRYNPSQTRTLCVSRNAAIIQLLKGASLGSCTDQVPTAPVVFEKDNWSIDALEKGGQITIKASPNPSTDGFRLQVTGSSKELLSLRITDATGNIIMSRTHIQSDKVITVGENWRPGIYFAEALQGRERAVVKLMKLK